MAIVDDARREFTARYLADLSKAIFAVALASKLFLELPRWLRVALPVVGVLFFVVAFFLYPKKAKEASQR